MIIGTIIEISNSTSTAGSSNTNGGGGCVIFQREADAVEWCQAMSQRLDFESGDTLVPYTAMYNTNTNVRRWWKSGTEYTG